MVKNNQFFEIYGLNFIFGFLFVHLVFVLLRILKPIIVTFRNLQLASGASVERVIDELLSQKDLVGMTLVVFAARILIRQNTIYLLFWILRDHLILLHQLIRFLNFLVPHKIIFHFVVFFVECWPKLFLYGLLKFTLIQFFFDTFHYSVFSESRHVEILLQFHLISSTVLLDFLHVLHFNHLFMLFWVSFHRIITWTQNTFSDRIRIDINRRHNLVLSHSFRINSSLVNFNRLLLFCPIILIIWEVFEADLWKFTLRSFPELISLSNRSL